MGARGACSGTAEWENICMSKAIQDPMSLTPKEFELAVKDVLSQGGATITNFVVTGSQVLIAPDGSYQIDATLDFELQGFSYKTLVECKRHSDPIKRDDVMLLKSKIDSLGAHKGIIFSTAVFQSGAVQYAEAHGIALVFVESGKSTYLAKNQDVVTTLPDWVPLFVGRVQCMGADGSTLSTLIHEAHPRALVDALVCEG